MGGIAGRVDAMLGAVESQKVTGALHHHFFIFVQRLHQYATLKEIAEKLQAGLVQAFRIEKLYVRHLLRKLFRLGAVQATSSGVGRQFPNLF